MKIFVTGATGVVGRRLVPILREKGHEVTAVVHGAAGRLGLERQGARPIDLDLFDAAAVRAAVAGHDVIVNLATHIPKSTMRMMLRGAWRENDRLRRVASATLVDAAIDANVPRLVQESFAPAYPDRGDRWIDETIPLSPVSYNLSLADAEASADRFTRRGRAGVVLRFGAFYGPDAMQTIEMVRWVRKGWAPLPGDPAAFVSSVSHDDAATATASAIALPAGIYNVVDDEPVSRRAFVDSMADALGVASPKFPPAWTRLLFGSLGEMLSRSVRISNRKLRGATGWSPRYASVRQGWPDVMARAEIAGSRVPGSTVREERT